ncbi:hypothetical protein ACJX0J_025248, partial [Zea mays]
MNTSLFAKNSTQLDIPGNQPHFDVQHMMICESVIFKVSFLLQAFGVYNPIDLKELESKPNSANFYYCDLTQFTLVKKIYKHNQSSSLPFFFLIKNILVHPILLGLIYRIELMVHFPRISAMPFYVKPVVAAL